MDLSSSNCEDVDLISLDQDTAQWGTLLSSARKCPFRHHLSDINVFLSGDSSLWN